MSTPAPTSELPRHRQLGLTDHEYELIEDKLERLKAGGQVVLSYAPGHNPNGSLDDIAGVCNEERNVFGLMPHPEHAVDLRTGSADGLLIFESLRAHVDARAYV
jgi:phosphoribosylformylglycinamidine synthase